jgi:hypothetical protein
MGPGEYPALSRLYPKTTAKVTLVRRTNPKDMDLELIAKMFAGDQARGGNC